LYKLRRDRVADLLTPLVRLPGFRVEDRRTVLRALELYASAGLDFGDALIAATMERPGSP
jgi:predicted nucleic-acid-binding protein